MLMLVRYILLTYAPMHAFKEHFNQEKYKLLLLIIDVA